MDLSKPIQKVNEYTKKNSGFFDLAEPYGLFRKLKVEGKSQLREIHYYHGERLPSHEYSPKTKPKWDELEPNIDLERVLSDHSCGHICFVGPAGIGKTTLTRSIARGVLEGIYRGLLNVVTVLFLHCSSYKPGDKISAAEFIFGQTDLSEKEIEDVFKFARSYPEKVLFILDSLDTLQYNVDGVYKYINLHEKACPEAILWNFLSGNLFPGCQIITSSREYTIRNYRGKVRPGKVIAILGLTKESILEVVIGYVGEMEAEEFMQYLETKAPSLKTLCNTPVLLVYSLIGYKASSDFAPTTSTGCLIAVLQSIIRSEHTRHEYILGVMHKLEELSYNGTQDGRVLFTYDDFSKVGLDPLHATDLTIFAPGGFTGKLLQGESRLFFSHETLQEVFSALWISKMVKDCFKKVVKSMLNTSRFVVVRKFLYGIFFDREIDRILSKDLLQGHNDFQAKIEILREDIRSQLSSGLNDSNLLELLMNEAKEGISDVVKSSLHRVWLDDFPLSSSDVFAIGLVISHCDYLDSLRMLHCSLDASSLNLLGSQLKESRIKLREFILRGDENMGIDGISAVGGIVTQNGVEKLDLQRCNLSAEQLRTLADSTRNATKLRCLNLYQNAKMGIDGISAVGRLVTRNDIEELFLSQCRLSAGQLQALADSTKDATKLRSLFLNKNVNMGIVGISAVGRIVTRNDVEELKLSECRLRAEQLLTLVDSTKDATTKLRFLNLWGNKNMGIDGISAVGRIVSQTDVAKLNLSYCRLSAEQLQTLAYSTKDATKLQVVDLSENRMKHDEVQAVANLLSNCTTEVNLCDCEIFHEDLRCLQNKLDELGKEGLHVKIDEYNLSAKSQVNGATVVVYSADQAETQKEHDMKADSSAATEGAKLSDRESTSVVLKEYERTRTSEDDDGVSDLGDVAAKRSGSWEKGLYQPLRVLSLLTGTSFRRVRHSSSLAHHGKTLKSGLGDFADSAHSERSEEVGQSFEDIQRDKEAKILGDSETDPVEMVIIGVSESEGDERKLATESFDRTAEFATDDRVKLPCSASKAYDCKITIPPRCLKADSTIKVTVESGNVDDRPNEYMTISPTMDCDLNKVQLVEGSELEVEMPTYCSADQPIEVELLSRTLGSPEWVRERRLTLLSNEWKLSFKTTHFSRKTFGILRRLGLGRLVKFRITPHLYYNANGIFRSYFCIDDKLLDKTIKEENRDNGYLNALVMPQRLIARLGESVNVQLQCSSSQSYHIAKDRWTFQLLEKVIDLIFVCHSFELNGSSTSFQQDIITFHFIRGNPGTLMAEDILRLNWPITLPGSSAAADDAKASAVERASADTEMNERASSSKHDKNNDKELNSSSRERDRPTTEALLTSGGDVHIINSTLNIMAGTSGTQFTATGEPKKEIEESRSES